MKVIKGLKNEVNCHYSKLFAVDRSVINSLSLKSDYKSFSELVGLVEKGLDNDFGKIYKVNLTEDTKTDRTLFQNMKIKKLTVYSSDSDTCNHEYSMILFFDEVKKTVFNHLGNDVENKSKFTFKRNLYLVNSTDMVLDKLSPVQSKMSFK